MPTTRRWPPCLHRILWQRTCGRKAPTSGQDFVLLQPKLSMQLCEAHWNPLTGIVRKVSQAAVSDSPDRSSPRYACMLEAKCACHLHLHETHWNPHPRGLFWSSSTRCKTPYAVLLLFARDVLQWFKHVISRYRQPTSQSGRVFGRRVSGFSY